MSVPLSVLICVSVIQLCLGVEETTTTTTTTTRNVPVLGGWNDVENATEVQEIQDAALSAVKTLNSKNDHKSYRLVSIISAQEQVVNVVNYEIKAVLKRIECRNPENQNLATCKLREKLEQCILSVTYYKKYETTEYSCFILK